MHDEHDTTVVTERGQTSIPASLRREMKLTRGTKLHWERVSDGEIRLRLAARKLKADPLAMIGFGASLPTAEPTEAYMRRSRSGER